MVSRGAAPPPGGTRGVGCERDRAARPGQRDCAGGLKVREMSGTGPRSGPAGATAPARRKVRSQASGASARRLRENKKARPGA